MKQRVDFKTSSWNKSLNTFLIFFIWFDLIRSSSSFISDVDVELGLNDEDDDDDDDIGPLIIADVDGIIVAAAADAVVGFHSLAKVALTTFNRGFMICCCCCFVGKPFSAI